MVANKYLASTSLCLPVNNPKSLSFFVGNTFLNSSLALFKIPSLWTINKNLLGFTSLTSNAHKIVLPVPVADIINALSLALSLIAFNDLNASACIKFGTISTDFFTLSASSI